MDWQKTRDEMMAIRSGFESRIYAERDIKIQQIKDAYQMLVLAEEDALRQKYGFPALEWKKSS